MFYTEASEKKRNKGEDQEIMSEFFAVCTQTFAPNLPTKPGVVHICSFTSARTESGDHHLDNILFQNLTSPD